MRSRQNAALLPSKTRREKAAASRVYRRSRPGEPTPSPSRTAPAPPVPISSSRRAPFSAERAARAFPVQPRTSSGPYGSRTSTLSASSQPPPGTARRGGPQGSLFGTDLSSKIPGTPGQSGTVRHCPARRCPGHNAPSDPPARHVPPSGLLPTRPDRSGLSRPPSCVARRSNATGRGSQSARPTAPHRPISQIRHWQLVTRQPTGFWRGVGLVVSSAVISWASSGPSSPQPSL
ncbi:hypothetical protein GA0115254_11504 [Streptomyces sp. Ncost-T10-10d]|nr:hypothetical protein GA0115254_11504 [Streptomyces sp. Ncost-T10-10d]